jgi:hypothetical protein
MIRTCSVLLVIYILCAAHPGAAAQEYHETNYFTIESTSGDRTGRFISRHADAIAETVSDLLGFTLTERAHVIIAADREHFQRVQPGGAHVPEWAAGVAWPQHNLIILLKGARGDILATFTHEVCHILLGQAFGPGQVPRWLDEGIAIKAAGQWSMQRMTTMAMAVLTGSVLPMEEIMHIFPRGARRAELAYCQSFYFIAFLKAKFGNDEFHTFLRLYSASRDFRLALRRAYYLDWEEIEQLWREYLKIRFSWLPILFSTGSLWFFAGLVFVWGYIHKKRKNRRKLRQWELEELLAGERTDDHTTLQ